MRSFESILGLHRCAAARRPNYNVCETVPSSIRGQLPAAGNMLLLFCYFNVVYPHVESYYS